MPCLAGRGRCRLQLASAASASARRPRGLLHPPPSSRRGRSSLPCCVARCNCDTLVASAGRQHVMVDKIERLATWVLTVLTVRRLLWRCRMMREIDDMSADTSAAGMGPCHTLQLFSPNLVSV